MSWAWIAGAVAVIVTFVVVAAWNVRRYAESFEPPDDLKRADESCDPTGGSPNGGWIWPGGL